MSKTRSSSQDRANETGDLARRVGGLVRRMAVGVTSRTFWQVIGHILPFDPNKKRETHDAEVFQGVGIVARPPDGSKTETIVVFPGGASQPVIVGSRDLKTARAAVGELAADETAIYTSAAIVIIKANGTVEIRTSGGAAVPLATKADLEKLETAIAGAVPLAGDGGATLKAQILTGTPTSLHGVSGAAPWPVGTTVLKAE